MSPYKDEELKRITIGERKPYNATITLIEYDQEWPKKFETERKRIREVLGEKALLVEHVGSTSVPGLAAKPIIDILLVVKDSADESVYVPFLEKAGYILRIREPSWFEHRLFKGPDYPTNLHVFTTGASEINRMLMFRNHLRGNEEDRTIYLKIKRELAKKKWKYVQNYADAKTEIINEIMARAGKSINQ